MAAKRIFQICLLFPYFLSIFCATTPAPAPTPIGNPTPIDTTVDIGPCTCDLTSAACDVNCCCDPDCTVDDRGAFKECTNRISALSSQMCVLSSLIFTNNTQYTVNRTDPSLFCVVTDNYQARNFYTLPSVANTSAAIKSYISRYQLTTYAMKAGTTYDFKSVTWYKSGDPVYTLFSSDSIGTLGFPKSGNTMLCNDDNPASYLMDETSECVRDLGQPLAQTCQTDKSLTADTYYKNFKVASTPEIFKPAVFDVNNPDSAFVIPLYNATQLVMVNPVLPGTCIDANGLSSPCTNTGSIPTPAYDTATKFCNYAVTQVEYEITHEGTKGILSVDVKFVLKNIKDSDLPLKQTFKVTWKQKNATATVVKSGNPGYKVGQPVLAGLLRQTTVGNEVRQDILLSSNRDEMLTMMTSSIVGSCDQNKNLRTPVKFGINMRSGCTFSVSLTNMSNDCQLIQDDAKRILLGGSDPPSYVATFGNSAVEKVGDWVPILTENDPTGASGSTTQKGLCSNMVLGMNLEIVYANVGSLANPQPKIIGVARVYDEAQELKYECYGPFCQPDTMDLGQNFEVTSSVTFVDASEKAVPFYAERPLLAIRLPYDFFYPFLSGGANRLFQNNWMFLVTLLFGFLVL
ncbi:tectonic-1-like [Lineus longissimus]|uniref:tectonic-1-like n=1 Tax=Lineus longissimus TaxID=88925 RepID=UPI002B4ED269